MTSSAAGRANSAPPAPGADRNRDDPLSKYFIHVSRLGVRRGRRAALRRRPAHGWDALTETEHKVALLVAEGLSNPDIATKMFLSRRTVQSHVSSILAKLELTSRVELAVSAQRRAGG
jgi:DNA-binding NarL/FixJ family response regulator